MAKVVKTFRCDPDLWARVSALTAAEGTNVSAVIVAALERYADPGDEGGGDMLAAAWSDSILWHSVGAVLLATFTAWVAAVCAGTGTTETDA